MLGIIRTLISSYCKFLLQFYKRLSFALGRLFTRCVQICRPLYFSWYFRFECFLITLYDEFFDLASSNPISKANLLYNQKIISTVKCKHPVTVGTCKLHLCDVLVVCWRRGCFMYSFLCMYSEVLLSSGRTTHYTCANFAETLLLLSLVECRVCDPIWSESRCVLSVVTSYSFGKEELDRPEKLGNNINSFFKW